MNNRPSLFAMIAAAVALMLLLLYVRSVKAQTTAPEPPCLPANAIVKGTGTDYKTFETINVKGEVGWCPSSSGGWRIAIHQWCLKTVCSNGTPISSGAIMAAIDRVMRAADPASQAAAEWAAVSITPRTDLELWQFKDWRYQACQWLSSTQPGVTPRPAMPIPLPNVFNPDGTQWMPPLTYCDVWDPGPKPTPPTGWVAMGTTIFKFANGRLTSATTQKATKGAPCDGITVVTAGAYTYQGLVGGAADEKTACVKP